MGVKINSIKIETLDAADLTVLRSQTYTTGSPVVMTKNRAGEYKRMTIQGVLTGGGTLVGKELRYVPALFVDHGLASGIGAMLPANSWMWYFASQPTPLQAAALQAGLFAPLNNVMRNRFVKARIVSSTEWEVVHEFYMTYDEDAWMPATGSNPDRFVRSLLADPIILTPSVHSVYLATKRDIGLHIQVRDPNTGFIEFDELNIDVRGAYYGAADTGAAADYQNGTFIFKRGGSPVTDLSTLQDTDVEFYADAVLTGNMTRCVLYIFRTDTTDNNVTFTQCIELSVATAGTPGGAWVAPTAAPVNIGGITFKATGAIDKTYLTHPGCYRVIAIAYDETGGSYASTSFISDQLCTTNNKPYDGNGWNEQFVVSDFHKTYPAETLTCTVEERLQVVLDLDYSYNQWANDIFNRLGLVVPNDIRRYLTQVRVLVYEERTDQAGILYTTYRRDYFVDVTLAQNPNGTFTTQNGMQFTAGLNAAALIYDFRVRYESHIQNLYTDYDGVVQPLPLANQNWGGRNLTCEIQLEFYYDDYVTPFTDRVIYRTYLKPKAYVTSPLSIDAKSVVCSGLTKCYKPTLDGSITDPENYRLIVTLEPLNGLSTTLGENEEYAQGILPQLDISAVVSQDVPYAAGTGLANFCIDTGMLNSGFTYKVVALAKFIQPGKTFKDSSFNKSYN